MKILKIDFLAKVTRTVLLVQEWVWSVEGWTHKLFFSTDMIISELRKKGK